MPTSRFSCLLGVFLGTLAAGSAASAQTGASIRTAQPRPDTTIFSPLDLPAPNGTRLGSGAPGPDYWQQQVDYVIEATLDEPTKRLDASMKVTYHNNSPHALDYIWLQLEQNLFKPDSDGSLSRAGGVMRAFESDFHGGFDIAHVRSGGEDLEFAIYDTLARVNLPEAIAPGEVYEFEVGFAFTMPPYMRRMGSQKVDQGTIFEYAQWFPHVCTYDDVYGWNTLPYLGTGEFYTNFGNFDVSLTVPRDHIVAATGDLENAHDVLTIKQITSLARARNSDATVVIRSIDEVGDPSSRPAGEGPLTWRFTARNVRTFVWASSPAYAWDACTAKVTDLEGVTRNVLCQSVYPGEAGAWFHDHEDGGSSQYIKHAIEFYSEFVYPYPYPQMTNVNGPEGGMEYPMMVFCGARNSPRGLFGVTDHEVGHSWFPMIVSTDERRHIWMDEGFNTFMNMYSRANRRGSEVNIGRARRQTMDDARQGGQPIVMAPDQMSSRWVGRLGYRKTGYGLYLLREYILGPERFDFAFKTYVRRWAFKSPQPADFFRTMEDAAGVDLAWFWRSWFIESTSLDQAVTEVSQSEGKPVRVTFFNNNEMVMPLEFDVTYDDESVERRRLPIEIWFSTNRWTASWDTEGRMVTGIEIDPDGILPDVEPENNTWSAADGEEAEEVVEESDTD